MKKEILPRKVQLYLRDLKLKDKIKFITMTLAVPIIFLLVLVMFFLIRELYVKLDENLRAGSEAITNNLEELGRMTREYAALIASSGAVQRELMSRIPNAGPLIAQGESIMKNSGIDEITIMESGGIVIARAHRSEDFGDSLKEHPAAGPALNGKERTVILHHQNEASLTSCVPVLSDKEIFGAVCAAYRLDGKFASRLSRLTGTHVFVIIDNKIKASSLGKITGGKVDETNEKFSRKATLKQPGEKNKTLYLEFARATIPFEIIGGDIHLAAAMDQSEERTRVNLAVILMLLSALTIISLATFISIKISRNITSAIAAISRGIDTVAAGSLDTRIEVASRDELGQLATTFNSMSAELQRTYSQLAQAKNEIEAHALHLEEKVRERTAELSASLAEVKQLKEKQDADYYLTSMLVIPLGGVHVQSETLLVKEVTRQKKKFSYRKFEREIGGDISSVKRIELKGKPYLAMINADAMGKSIQGAGGALVIGAAFDAITNRSAAGLQDMREPEFWLWDVFSELHRLFAGFDAAMLVSSCIALADETSGVIFFANAEHPFTTLFRKGKAIYIENENRVARKLGMPVGELVLHVNTIRLQEGDRLIFGTDGREDLLVQNQNGETILNENPNLFLEVVTRARGDVNVIVELLPEYGAVTDDISLLSLETRGRLPNTPGKAEQSIYLPLKELLDRGASRECVTQIEKELSNWKWLKNMRRLYIRALALDKQINRALTECLLYNDDFPEDTRMLFESARLARAAHNRETMEYVLRRLKLREPGHAQYSRLYGELREF